VAFLADLFLFPFFSLILSLDFFFWFFFFWMLESFFFLVIFFQNISFFLTFYCPSIVYRMYFRVLRWELTCCAQRTRVMFGSRTLLQHPGNTWSEFEVELFRFLRFCPLSFFCFSFCCFCCFDDVVCFENPALMCDTITYLCRSSVW
jgi:hypothetical protein